MTVDAVPRPDVGPIAAIRRSGELLRRSWGEQLIGGGGIGLVFGLLAILVLFVGSVLAVTLGTSCPARWAARSSSRRSWGSVRSRSSAPR